MTGQFCSLDLDSFSSASGQISDNQVNYAIRILTQYLEPIGALTFNYSAGVSSYSTLSSSIFSTAWPMKIHSVLFNGSQLLDYARRPGLHSVSEFQILYPDWTSPGAGDVIAAAQIGQRLILYPAPTASGVTQIVSTFIPFPLTNDSQVPDLPIELHEAIAYLAAAYAARPTMTEQEAINRVMSYDNQWAMILKTSRSRYQGFQHSGSYEFNHFPDMAHAHGLAPEEEGEDR